MARTKEFDPEAALRAALELFWERGYEATSMADLVEHLGIARASLYSTFGGKHELYMKALYAYTEARDVDPIAMLAQPGPTLPAVRALIELYTEESVNEPRGCMIVNAAAEMLPGDRTVARFVEANWAALEAALTTAFIRARAQGELPEGRDPQALARFVLVFLQGLKVMAKGSPDPARLRQAAAQALSMLS
ncbi:TetR/AcrR family transcriptional repressor of nem operon [Thermocatellispora tengchongensis]|uniref:TetR/AcrR family transcriptional repressor of nem operon n=1 Tax=Thermocatellispora tengchongensis TaxID=1073253 RepID=A0A840NS89_9ACTN|nr:TetR/AcrR family transcriptional regulator [Thermocatellispora tengchongensis]MBB5130438.1 TetR/AcrR family transcriptional repressor of nem operon [Thermocatellispora tengchongensis]